MEKKFWLIAGMLFTLCTSVVTAQAATVTLKGKELAVDGKTVTIQETNVVLKADGTPSGAKSAVVYYDEDENGEPATGPVEPGVYFFDGKNTYLGFVPGEDAAFVGVGYLSPDEKRIALDSGTSAGMRSLTVYSWPTLQPIGASGVGYLGETIAWGENALYTTWETYALDFLPFAEPRTLETEPKRPCPSEVCGPRAVFRTDLTSGVATLVARGTQLCDMEVAGTEGDNLVIHKICVEKLAGWDYPAVKEKKPTVERILMPLAEVEATAKQKAADIKAELKKTRSIKANIRPICEGQKAYFVCQTEDSLLIALCAQSATSPKAILRVTDASKKPLITLPQKPGDTADVAYASLNYESAWGNYINFKDGADTQQALYTIFGLEGDYAGLVTFKNGKRTENHICIPMVDDPDDPEAEQELSLENAAINSGYAIEDYEPLSIPLFVVEKAQ